MSKLGDIRVMNNGLTATVIRYKNYNDIDVEFENGYVSYNKSYSAFKTGRIGVPDVKKNRIIGEKKVMTNGHIAEIIDYKTTNNITIKFDNGIIRKNVAYNNFKKGNVSLTARKRFKELSVERIGDTSVARDGTKIVIIEYKGTTRCRVRFENGFEKWCSYADFKSGHLTPTTAEGHNRKQIGDVIITKRGEKCELLKRLPKDKLLVRFDNGIEKEIDTKAFKPNSGVVSDLNWGKPSIKVGDKFDTNCGLSCEVVEYITSKNLTIKFEDGKILKNIKQCALINGQVRHPNLFGGDRLFCGYKMKEVYKSGRDTYYKVYKGEEFLGIMTPREILEGE